MEEAEAMELVNSQETRWQRPPPPLINPRRDSIIFQQIDIESYTAEAMAGTVSNIIIRIFMVHS